MFVYTCSYRNRYWKKSLFDAVAKVQVALKRIYQGHVTLGEASIRWMYHHSKLDGQHGGMNPPATAIPVVVIFFSVIVAASRYCCCYCY